MRTAFAEQTSIPGPGPIEREAPFGDRLHRAVDYLVFKAQNRNAVQACGELEKIIAEQRKYSLFKQLFPDKWETSKTSLFKKGTYENYSERENELFELVDKELFPLLSDWNEDPEMDFDNFSTFSLNVDFCCEEIEYEYLRVSYVAALLFLSRDEEISEFFAQNYKLSINDLPPINEQSHENLWNLGKTGRSGLFVNILEVVDHSTGNPWMDTRNCDYNTSYSWDEETIQYLAESYIEAQDILDKTCRLDELIEKNPRQVLREMISFWNTAEFT